MIIKKTKKSQLSLLTNPIYRFFKTIKKNIHWTVGAYIIHSLLCTCILYTHIYIYTDRGMIICIYYYNVRIYARHRIDLGSCWTQSLLFLAYVLFMWFPTNRVDINIKKYSHNPYFCLDDPRAHTHTHIYTDL